MQSDTYNLVRSAFDALGDVQDTGLRTIDTENVIVARRQLAWSIRRWGQKHEGGIPADAAALADDAKRMGAGEYEHRHAFVDKDETVEIPDDAIGVTTDTFGGAMSIHYLVPAEAGDGDE